MFRHRHEADLPVVEEALGIVHAYVTRLLESGVIQNVQIHNAQEDSQEYGSDIFADVQVEILEYIGVCDPSFTDCVRLLIFRLSTVSYFVEYGMCYALPCVLEFHSNHPLGRKLSRPGR